jgi:hypothetical protein
VVPDDAEGSWRIARKVAADRVISVVDPDARHMCKSRSSHRDGYLPGSGCWTEWWRTIVAA